MSEKPLRPWIVFNKENEIECAHCDCVAGLGESCSHVAALLFALEKAHTDATQSVTDVLAYWIGPSNKHRFFQKACDVDWRTPQTILHQHVDDEEEMISDTEKLIPIAKKEEMVAFLHEINEAGVKCALHAVVEPFCNQQEKLCNVLASLYKEEYKTYSLEQLQELAHSLKLTISQEECQEIEKLTRSQTASKKWFLYRKGRVTASNFKAVVHTNIIKPSCSLIKKLCYPVRFKAEATAYGCHHEKTALEQYKKIHFESHDNARYRQSGLVINTNYPYFGASPDGIVTCNCCGEGCVEVKCPFCIKDGKVENLMDKRSNYIYYNEDNKLCLDSKHSYYYQIQMQMALCGYNYCDFIIWTRNDIEILRIPFNDEFWYVKSSIAKQFCEKVLLPELLGK